MHLPPGSMDLMPIIPVVAIGVWGTLRVLKGQIGRALADRIRGHHALDAAEDMEILRNEIDSLRMQLDEAQDRIDFMDKLLQRQREDAVPTPI